MFSHYFAHKKRYSFGVAIFVENEKHIQVEAPNKKIVIVITQLLLSESFNVQCYTPCKMYPENLTATILHQDLCMTKDVQG